MTGALVLRPKAQPGHSQVSKSSSSAFKIKTPQRISSKHHEDNLEMMHLSETEDLSLLQHQNQPFLWVNVKFRLLNPYSRLNVLV